MGDFDDIALAVLESSVKYHPVNIYILISLRESACETVPGGQFAWGESLLKHNEGVQRFP